MKLGKQIHYLIFAFLLIFMSCSKESEIVEKKLENEAPKYDFILCEDEDFKSDSTLDCDCDSEIIYVLDSTIEANEGANLSVGFLGKLKPENLPDDYPYSYRIVVNDSVGGVNTYAICNDLCVSSSFDSALLSSGSIKVKFFGSVKRICRGLSVTLNVTDRSIILKEIAKIE